MRLKFGEDLSIHSALHLFTAVYYVYFSSVSCKRHKNVSGEKNKFVLVFRSILNGTSYYLRLLTALAPPSAVLAHPLHTHTHTHTHTERGGWSFSRQNVEKREREKMSDTPWIQAELSEARPFQPPVTLSSSSFKKMPSPPSTSAPSSTWPGHLL